MSAKMNASGKLRIQTNMGPYNKYGRVAGARNVQFSTTNPFDALQSAISSGSRDSGDSLSPGASETSSGTLAGKAGVAGTSAIPATSNRQKEHVQQQASHGSQMNYQPVSPNAMRRMSATPMIPSTQSSPIRMRNPGAEASNVQAPRRGSMLNQGRPNLYVPPALRRDPMIQDSGRAQASPRRRSTASGMQPPMFLHPLIDAKQTINGINQVLAVQEFAYRRGQADRDAGRDRMPKNPFGPFYDLEWAGHYQRGKNSVVPALRPFPNPPSPSRANYAWPALINPYSQSQEHPNGSYDPFWVRDVCVRALDGMAVLISKVIARGYDWQRIVCDVPAPIARAMRDYPDLFDAYENMKRDAQEAVAGGRPQGYDFH